jgi:hypothetical protein
MPGAQQVLRTARFILGSGNRCDVTIGMAPGEQPGEIRIGVQYAWGKAPGPGEEAAMQAEVEAILSMPGPVVKVFQTEGTPDRAQSEAINRMWLEKEKKPAS